MNFEDLIAKVKTCGKQKLAVAAAEDDADLEAVDAAHKQGIADAILVGDEAAIRKIAAELNIDLSDYEIINEPDKVQASLKAVKLAHDGVANMYMKGLLDTKTFLKSVLDKEVGLRTGKTLSTRRWKIKYISSRIPLPWPMPAALPAPRLLRWPPLRSLTRRCPAPSMPTSCAR